LSSRRIPLMKTARRAHCQRKRKKYEEDPSLSVRSEKSVLTPKGNRKKVSKKKRKPFHFASKVGKVAT